MYEQTFSSAVWWTSVLCLSGLRTRRLWCHCRVRWRNIRNSWRTFPTSSRCVTVWEQRQAAAGGFSLSGRIFQIPLLSLISYFLPLLKTAPQRQNNLFNELLFRYWYVELHGFQTSGKTGGLFMCKILKCIIAASNHGYNGIISVIV